MMDYIDGYDEKAEEIQQTFSYDGYQIVRREMFAHQREAAVTIRQDSITFNTACIEGLEDTVYIQILVSDSQHRLVIKKSGEDVKDSLRWCVAKPDKRKSRKIIGRFSQMLYKVMNWQTGCRYKILGHKIVYQGETLYVFELDECEIFRERIKRTKQEKEERINSMTPEQLEEEDKKERKESMTPFSPSDALGTFGLPVNQHEDIPIIQDMNTFRPISIINQSDKEGDT